MSQVDSLRDCPLYCSSLYSCIHVCNYLSMINERLLIVNQQSTMSSVTSGDVCPDLGRVPVDTSLHEVHQGVNPKENRD